MSLNEPSEPKENSFEELKAKLDAFVSSNAITQFEGEDIVELIEEGEDPDWIVEQLKSNSPDMNVDEAKQLLANIRTLRGPANEPEGHPEEMLQDDAAAGEPALENGMPDLSQIDLSKLDLSQLADALPPGIKLPPGVDMKQIQNMLESPQGRIMSDFLLFCSEKGIQIDEGSLDDPATQDLQDEWKSTPREAFDGKTPEEMMQDNPGGFLPEKVKTFRREEPRVGRNDPCPCGSGKKYKKCCGGS
jgi:hypothetical protein